jgi:iron complex outermembrane recepter protein
MSQRTTYLNNKNILVYFFLLSLLAGKFSYSAEPVNEVVTPMVISASRFAQTPFETSASIDIVSQSQIQDAQAQNNISESLVSVPGVIALNRQNYAQDTMISIRGFGANSSFGARGIRVYEDGIPATMPDGQSQLSHIDLSSTERIEVLRGPFSVLYGTSAGGVMSIFSENGKPGAQITPYSTYGSFNTSKVGIKAAGDTGEINYLLNISNLNTAGYRDHSDATRDNENAKIIFGLNSDTQIKVLGNRVNLSASDPLGLTASQYMLNPQAAGTNATTWNTRKTVTQMQGGLELTHKIDNDSSVKLVGYGGTRNQFQFQAPSSSTVPFVNGAISLDRTYQGFDGQYQIKSIIQDVPVHVTVGLTYGNDDDHSKGYCNSYGTIVNCTGKTTSVSSDGAYTANNFDQYLQLTLDPTEQINVTLGLRNTSTQLRGSDNLGVWTANSRTYNALLPMASASYLLNPLNRIYVSVGGGYDTPTLNQIKYSCGNAACTATPSNSPNLLNAATTTQYEIGWKSILPEMGYVNAAIFTAQSDNELVPAANVSGKTVFENANGTSRTGFELFGHFDLMNHFYSNLSYTYTSAKVTSDYSSANGLITSGSRIPGVPTNKLFAELAWKLPKDQINLGVEAIAQSDMFAADNNNLANSNASGYVIANIRAIAKQEFNRWKFQEFARLNNLFDVQYIGSVIVNQTSFQYFEPAPGRNWVIGLNGSYSF